MAQSESFWDKERKSPFRWISFLVWVFLIFAAPPLLALHGPRHKPFHFLSLLLVWNAGWIVVTTVHELGHTLVAWALGFRFVALNIGPFTIVKDQWGHRHVRFEWKRTMFEGYAAAVPVSEKHIRSSVLLVVFAGPLASLIAGLLCWLVYLNLPGSGWEAYWDVPGILAVLFVVGFGANLVPVGNSDGSMLLHLLLWTKRGRELSALHIASKTANDAEGRLVEQDFAGEVQLRRKALEQMLASGDASALQLGHSYQALAFALLNHAQRREAEVNFQKSIEIFHFAPGIDPIHEANSWKGLVRIYRLVRNVDEALRTANAAIAAYEKATRSLDNSAEVSSAIAALHADSGRYELGLNEARRALVSLPVGPRHLVRKADLLRVKMRCQANLGYLAEAGVALSEAANLLRSLEIPETKRMRAASEMGTLASTAWLAGVGETSAELFRESIQKLEKKGRSSRAVVLRIVLASILREEGKLADAEAALPAESDIEPERRFLLLRGRARLFAETGRISQSVADAREALELEQQQGRDNTIEIATARADLAEFLQADGKFDEAEDQARRACDELLPRRHPDAAGALVTLALIRNDASSAVRVEDAIALVRDAPLLEAGAKARALEELNRRVNSSSAAVRPE